MALKYKEYGIPKIMYVNGSPTRGFTGVNKILKKYKLRAEKGNPTALTWWNILVFIGDLPEPYKFLAVENPFKYSDKEIAKGLIKKVTEYCFNDLAGIFGIRERVCSKIKHYGEW